MRKYNKLAYIGLSILYIALMVACSTPKVNDISNTTKKDLKLVYIISDKVRFYDFGIVDTNPNEATLEIFKLGKSIGKFVIKDDVICFMEQCALKWPASKSFFGKVSYDNLFEDILRKNDIFDGIGKHIEANNTIVQTFNYGGEKIYYERSDDRVYFKNLTNGVIISIENYNH